MVWVWVILSLLLLLEGVLVADHLDDVMRRGLHPGQPLGLGEEVVLDAPGARSVLFLVVVVFPHVVVFLVAVGAAATEDTAAGHITGDVTGLTGSRSTATTTTTASGSLPPPDGPDVVLDGLLEVGVLVPVVVQLGALQDRQAVEAGDGEEPHVLGEGYRRRGGGSSSRRGSFGTNTSSGGSGAEGRSEADRHRRLLPLRSTCSRAVTCAVGIVSQIPDRDGMPCKLAFGSVVLLVLVVVVGTRVVAPPPGIVLVPAPSAVAAAGSAPAPASASSAAEHSPQDAGRQLRPSPPACAAAATHCIGGGCRPHLLVGATALWCIAAVVVFVTVTGTVLLGEVAAAVGATAVRAATSPTRGTPAP